MTFLQVSAVLLTLVTLTSATSSLIQPALIGGIPADEVSRFPYHVTIEPIRSSYSSTYKLCGGTILSDKWIITSAFCVAGSVRIQIHFERLYINNIVGSYIVVVNSNAIHAYPTEADDIAMVQLPIRLDFSDNLKAVSLSATPVAQLVGKFAVLPGFNGTTEFTSIGSGTTSTDEADELSYVLLKIISNSVCKQLVAADFFDQYLQMCTEGWERSKNAPCFTDWGSGLVIGWPTKPELVGVFSKFYGSCDGPHVYTNIIKYSAWIENLLVEYICD